MKKKLSIILIASLLLPLIFAANVFATGETVTIDGITYTSYGTYCAVTGYDDSVSGKLNLPLSVDFGGTELPLTVIDDYAFSYSGLITEITVPVSVNTIKEYAFFDCIKLRKVTLSAGVSSIDATAFYKCIKLKSIEVDSCNDYYASSDNVLYSKDMHTIIAYPPALTATEFTIPDGVTRIGDMAFSCCSNLTGITIPDGVTRIGYYAFAECSGIQSFDLPETLEAIDFCAFEMCTALSSIKIPNSVTIIDKEAFNYCGNLTSVIIGSGVTYLGATVFANCPSLSDAYYNGTETKWNNDVTDCGGNDNLTSILRFHNDHIYDDDYDLICDVCGFERNNPALVFADRGTYYELIFCDGSYEGDLVIPSSVTIDGKTMPVSVIGEKAFRQCQLITSITLPDTIMEIGDEAFLGCKALASINIPDGVTTIGERVFYSCSALQSITVPGSVTSLSDYAFCGCDGLQSVIIENGLTYISTGAFVSCSALNSVTIPRSVKTIEDYAFYDCGALTSITIPDGVTTICMDAFSLCTALESVTIGEGVTEIGVNTFYGCTVLHDVIIGNGVTLINDFAFYNCTGLESISIPDNVTAIGNGAFENCTSLTSAAIGDGVTEIGNFAFYNCSLLSSVYIGDSAADIGKYAFGECPLIASVYYGDAQAALDTLSAENEGNGAIMIEVIPHADHSFGEWITDAAATSTTVGRKHRVCADCGFTEHAVIFPDVELSSVSVTLHSKIDMNFKADKNLLADIGYTEPYVVFECDGVQTTVTDFAVDGGQYVFKFCNLTPDRMKDPIKATLYAKYGSQTYVSSDLTYNVSDYCYDMLDNTTDSDAELRTLLVDMLHYGAAAQIYTGRNTNDLADKDLTATQLSWGTKTSDLTLNNITDAHYAAIPSPEAVWESAGLSLNDSVNMRFTFAANDKTGITVIIKDKYDNVLCQTDTITGSNGTYIAKFNGFSVTQMSEELYITAYRNNQPISDTLRYSIESYAYAKQNVTENHLGDLVIAMMKYGKAAYAYAH